MTLRVIFSVLLAGLALPGFANADAASDLRVTLGRQQATQPLAIEDLLGKLSPVSVQPMVDFAPVLLRQLDGATLARQSDELHDGKPTHLLVFDVPLPASASKQMTIKHYTGQIMVWLGADGVPVAVRNGMQVKGRKMLISIEFGNTTDYRLGVIGTRLVVLSRHNAETHSVFGKAGSSITDAVLTLAGD